MTHENNKHKLGLLLLTAALLLPAGLIALSGRAALAANSTTGDVNGWGALTNTGKIYALPVNAPAGTNEKCFTDELVGGLRRPNADAIANNPFCKCLDGIKSITASNSYANPTSWLIKAGGANNDPSNYAYEAKLRANNAVDDYCRCRNTNSGGYCTCLYADQRTATSCREYNPPSYSYNKLQDPNAVTYKSIGECQATGQSFSYCNCRMNGGSNSRCLGQLGTDSQYDAALASCQTANSANAPAALVLNYCTCTAAGNDDTSCQNNSGYAAYLAKASAGTLSAPDAKASALTEEQKKSLATTTASSGTSTGSASASASSSSSASSAGTTTASASSRLFGLPSIVPECARTASNEAPSLNCLMQVFGNIANLIVGVTGSMALLMFVYGGFEIIRAAGDDKKVAEGKNILKTAVIGIAIILLSGYVVNYALGKLGVTAPVQGAKCVAGSKPPKLSNSGTGTVVNLGTDSYCVSSCADSSMKKAGYACADYRNRSGGKTDCLTGLCPGDQYNICCPTSATK